MVVLVLQSLRSFQWMSVGCFILKVVVSNLAHAHVYEVYLPRQTLHSLIYPQIWSAPRLNNSTLQPCCVISLPPSPSCTYQWSVCVGGGCCSMLKDSLRESLIINSMFALFINEFRVLAILAETCNVSSVHVIDLSCLSVRPSVRLSVFLSLHLFFWPFRHLVSLVYSQSILNV